MFVYGYLMIPLMDALPQQLYHNQGFHSIPFRIEEVTALLSFDSVYYFVIFIRFKFIFQFEQHYCCNFF